MWTGAIQGKHCCNAHRHSCHHHQAPCAVAIYPSDFCHLLGMQVPEAFSGLGGWWGCRWGVCTEEEGGTEW